jgi:hypothetical protein
MLRKQSILTRPMLKTNSPAPFRQEQSNFGLDSSFFIAFRMRPPAPGMHPELAGCVAGVAIGRSADSALQAAG